MAGSALFHRKVRLGPIVSSTRPKKQGLSPVEIQSDCHLQPGKRGALAGTGQYAPGGSFVGNGNRFESTGRTRRAVLWRNRAARGIAEIAGRAGPGRVGVSGLGNGGQF